MSKAYTDSILTHSFSIKKYRVGGNELAFFSCSVVTKKHTQVTTLLQYIKFLILSFLPKRVSGAENFLLGVEVGITEKYIQYIFFSLFVLLLHDVAV